MMTSRVQGQRAYGEKYDPSEGYVKASEISRRVRAEIKAQVKAGVLPAVTYSVTCDNFTGGRSVNVTIIDLPEAWTTGTDRYGMEAQVLTEEAKRVRDAVERIRSAWNYDGSDAMTDYYDVNYYGHTDVESEWDRDYRLREKARKAAIKEAKAAKAAQPA